MFLKYIFGLQNDALMVVTNKTIISKVKVNETYKNSKDVFVFITIGLHEITLIKLRIV